MKKVLIVWSEVPEATYFIELEADEELFERLKTYHNKYINGCDENGYEVNKLHPEMINFFYGNETGYLKFEKTTTPMSGHFDLVILTGFLL
jgi:hypothetical protein